MDKFSDAKKYKFSKFTNLNDWCKTWLTDWQTGVLKNKLKINRQDFSPVYYTATVQFNGVTVAAFQNSIEVGKTKIERDW